MINIFLNILDKYFSLNYSKFTPLEYRNSFKNYEKYKNLIKFNNLNKKCDFTCLNLYKSIYIYIKKSNNNIK